MIFKFGKILISVIIAILFLEIFNEIYYLFFSNDNSVSSVTSGEYEIRYDYNDDETEYFLYNWKLNKVEIENIEMYKIDRKRKKIYIISKNTNDEIVYSILKYDSFELNTYVELEKFNMNDRSVFKNDKQFIRLEK